MAKAKRKLKPLSAKKTSPAADSKGGASPKPIPGLIETLESPKAIAAFAIVMFVAIFLLYKPITMDGLDSSGGDVISGIGITKQIKAYEAETGHKPLWNPNMFAGMPLYHRHQNVSWSLDNLFLAIDSAIDWRVCYLLIGALGMLFLLRYLGVSTIAGMTAGIAFVLLPHFHALVVVGHFAKLRALMWIPWILLTFLWMMERRNLAGAALFTAFFALQMRTQHFQIVFYTMLMMTFIGIVPYINMIREKRWPDFARFNGLLAAAILLVGMITAQSVLVSLEYTPWSTRGGNAVSIDKQVTEENKKGVGFDYATGWSYTVPEFWNLVVHRFHGGTSREIYDGDAVPQLKGRPFGAYWGDLPFTQSYEYLGVIIALLALLGIVLEWRRLIVRSLTLFTLFALLLSLGKHFALLYKFFFNYIPFFDKFRVPMMILTMVAFAACVLAAFGLNALMQGRLKDANIRNRVYAVSGMLAALLLFALLFGGSLYAPPAAETQQIMAQYGPQQGPQVVQLFQDARLEILKDAAVRALGFFIAGALVLFLMVTNRLNRQIGAILVGLLITIDLGLVTQNYLEGKFVDLDQLERRNYAATEVDRAIKADTGIYRVMPPPNLLGGDARWAYHYQSIAGYSALKLQVIQDLIENNLGRPVAQGVPFNLNVANMLNAKYVVGSSPYSHPDLTEIASLPQQRLFAYRNSAALPRAFLVGETQVFDEKADLLQFMNTAEFNPANVALLDSPLESEIARADSNSFAELTSFDPDRLVIEVETDVQTLLVLSEVYYPKGWTATLETGETLPIHKTNHILRSVVVPAGKHTVTMTFSPSSYTVGVALSWIGWLLTYAGIGVAFGGMFSGKAREEAS